MGLPGQRRNRSSKRRRASHFALKPVKSVACPQCGKPALPHVTCKSCGTYKGKQVIKTKTDKKLAKKAKTTK
ncbi:MAG: 50S ribosomal protein L32 [bacterium]